MNEKSENIYEIARRNKVRELYVKDARPKWKTDLTQDQVQAIARHADRFGHTEQEVTEAVLSNEVAFRFVLGKHVGRMDYWETALASYLESLPMVKSATKLPKNGRGRLYVVGGRLQSEKPDSLHIKSIDIEVQFKNGNSAYVIHKFTAEAGGAQDNQWREAMAAIEQLKVPGRPSVNLVAVLDGEYYVMPRRSSSGMSRLEETKQQHPYAIVCTYEQFAQATKEIWG